MTEYYSYQSHIIGGTMTSLGIVHSRSNNASHKNYWKNIHNFKLQIL